MPSPTSRNPTSYRIVLEQPQPPTIASPQPHPLPPPPPVIPPPALSSRHLCPLNHPGCSHRVVCGVDVLPVRSGKCCSRPRPPRQGTGPWRQCRRHGHLRRPAVDPRSLRHRCQSGDGNGNGSTAALTLFPGASNVLRLTPSSSSSSSNVGGVRSWRRLQTVFCGVCVTGRCGDLLLALVAWVG